MSLTDEEREAVELSTTLIALWRDDEHDQATDVILTLPRLDLEITLAYLLTLVTVFVDDEVVNELALRAQAEVGL